MQPSTLWGRCWGWGLFAVLVACATPQPPTVTPQVARVVQVNPKGVELQVTLAVNNPNAFALSAHEVQGTLWVEGGQKLGTGKANPEQSIPAHGVGSVESRVQIDWEDVHSSLPPGGSLSPFHSTCP